MGILRGCRGLWVCWTGSDARRNGRTSACGCPCSGRRELTLKKGDIVYIHKEVDKNWLEGEHHGRLGIFPANYVEVSREGWEQEEPHSFGRDLECKHLYPSTALPGAGCSLSSQVSRDLKL